MSITVHFTHLGASSTIFSDGLVSLLAQMLRFRQEVPTHGHYYSNHAFLFSSDLVEVVSSFPGENMYSVDPFRRGQLPPRMV